MVKKFSYFFSILGLALVIPHAFAVVQSKELYLYNWSEYLPKEVIASFEKETGIKVFYSTYTSNEAMYAKIKLLDKKNSYDLVVPSTYFLSKMRNENNLAKIDKSLLKNFKNLDNSLLDKPFDPKNEYSVPYLWGTTGIAVQRTRLKEAKVSAWADLWRPEFKQRILMTNDMREVFYVGLKVVGYSGNSTDPKQIETAFKMLKTLAPSIKVYNSDAPRTPYLEGETDVGMIWNGEVFLGRKKDKALSYVYPKEGAIIWMDSFVIPKNARNVANAHQFIDYILRPAVAKKISETVGYASPNQAAVALLSKEVREDRVVYPQEVDLKNAEFLLDVGSAIGEYQKYWEKLKLAR